MIINNEIKNSSKKVKRRRERKLNMDRRIKTSIDKIKEAKKKKFNMVKFLKIEIVKIQYANEHGKLENALTELYKTKVTDLNLHETKKEFLRYYTFDLEMIGKLSVGDQI